MDTTDIIKEYRLAANQYNNMMRELGQIRRRKAFKIIEIRNDPACKSYADAERQWEQTKDGQREIRNHHYCKGLEKGIIKLLDTELRVIRDDNWAQK